MQGGGSSDYTELGGVWEHTCAWEVVHRQLAGERRERRKGRLGWLLPHDDAQRRTWRPLETQSVAACPGKPHGRVRKTGEGEEKNTGDRREAIRNLDQVRNSNIGRRRSERENREEND